MERSSPLAAMQVPSLSAGRWGFGPDLPTSNASCGGSLFGPSSFNFKDISMKKNPMDYFSSKHVRGSSPTASLAADLSQNFHIDRSPQVSTPRRSLFSSKLFGTSNGRELVTTPPIPSSSPGPGIDSMDISPLPHKAPFAVSNYIEIQPPTPRTTEANDTPMTTPEMVGDQVQETSKPPSFFERRKSNPLRPSLARKGVSTSNIPLRTARPDSQLPAFTFGNGPTVLSPSLMSLDECFISSPSPEKRPQSANPQVSLMGPPRLKQLLSGSNAYQRNNCPQMTNYVRKPANPTQRPRKQFRRSLSMFEHPAEVIMKQDQPAMPSIGSLQSIMDVDAAHQLQVPHFTQDEDSLPRITKHTMVDIITGKYDRNFDQKIIVDCRFEYEYKGGHIDGAVNFNNKEEFAGQLLKSSSSLKTLLIFHCEYSAHRAPFMAKFVRQQDRAANAHQYPQLTYPEMYILDGGYSSFFQDHRVHCFPQQYVEMAAKEHANACEQGLGRMKQQRAKLSRAQTFAFGSHSPPIEDSPTGPGRQCSTILRSMDIALDQNLDYSRMQSRRLESY